MDEDFTSGRKGKFARCIICSDYSIRNNCFNIFSTTLKNGKILLSEFLKNVLDCSVLIVVSPEFFICKRCYTLCHNLDCSLARCNDLQGKIRTLFKHTEKKMKMRKEGDIPEEDLNNTFEDVMNIKEEIEDDFMEEELLGEGLYEEPLENNEDTVDVDGVYPNLFLSAEFVDNEVIVEGTNDSSKEPYSENQPSTEIEVEQPQNEEVVEGKVLQEDPSQDGMLMCETCGLCFENEEKLTYHKRKSDSCRQEVKSKIKSVYEFQHFSVKLKKKKKVFFCNRCTYETTTPSDIQEHLKSHKTDPEYMCDICGKRFKFLKTFNRHKQVHDESRPFACKFCAFRAMTEVLLRIHERQHDDQKKYTCAKCGYKTLKKMSYLIHCRTHTGERPYCCPTCPYKAKDPSTLERHRRIHGGIRRYQCTICDYKSVQKAALTMHMKTHTGEKPYACEHCDYRSSAKHNLKAHIAAIHSDEKPFACTQCSYKTKLKRLLTYHMRKHSDEKPYGCMYCECRFRYRSALSYHLSKKHPVDQDGVVQTYYVLNYCESKKLKFNGEDLVFSDEADSESESEATQ